MRSLYFAIATSLVAGLMLGFGAWVSIRSLQLTSPSDSLIVPGEIILAVGGHEPRPRP